MIRFVYHISSILYFSFTKYLWFFTPFFCFPALLQAEILVVEIANTQDDLLSNISVTLQGHQITQQSTTDADGRCRFYALPPGQYTIAYTYQNQPNTHPNLSIAPDAITELILTTQSQHHQINYLRTGTAHDITLSMLHKSPISNITQWATLQPGISQHQNKIHFRGGRAEEMRVYIDGLPEPINHHGQTVTHPTTTNATHVTIAKSGFNAQYGHAMSGIIHVVTPHFQRPLFGNLEGTTDHPSGYGQNQIAATLGSTLPNHKITTILTTHWQHATDADPRHSVGVQKSEEDLLSAENLQTLSKGQLPHNGQTIYALRGYVKVGLSDNLRMQTRLTHNKQTRQYYEHSYRYNLRHAPKIEHRSHSFTTQLHWQKEHTHLTARITQNTYHYQQGDGIHFDTLFAYGRPTGNPGFDNHQLFWLGDQTNTPTEITPNGFSIQDEGHVYNEFLKQKIQTRTPLDLHITTQLTPNHTVQAGFQCNFHTLRSYQHLTPTFISRTNQNLRNVIKYGYDLNSQTQSIYTTKDAKTPLDATAYIHGKTEFRDIIIDLGLRFDYFSAHTQLPRNESDPLGGDTKLTEEERVSSRSYLSLSPRVGLNLKITSQTTFHAHFGVFRQIPTYATLFTDLNYFAQRVSQSRTTYAFGNPNLALARTGAFEMGLAHNISPQTHLDATVYLKRTVKLAQRTTILAQPAHYDSYHSTNIATLRGVELTAQFHPDPFLAFQIAYSYSYHAGTGISDHPEIDLAPGFPTYLGNPSTRSVPLASERRHALNAQFNLNFPAQFWAYALVQTSTGRAYTPTEAVSAQIGFLNTIPNSGALHSARTSGLFRLDLKTGKTFNTRTFQIHLFIMATNITNHSNTRAVYSATGHPQVSGWLTTEDGRDFLTQFGETGQKKYEIKEQNPLNNGSPRHIHVGMRIQF